MEKAPKEKITVSSYKHSSKAVFKILQLLHTLQNKIILKYYSTDNRQAMSLTNQEK